MDIYNEVEDVLDEYFEDALKEMVESYEGGDILSDTNYLQSYKFKPFPAILEQHLSVVRKDFKILNFYYEDGTYHAIYSNENYHIPANYTPEMDLIAGVF